ncbi:MAG: twin-arginine translocation signal domain-containing protein [Ignavibacteria bacterium]|nr:twin-arginine translocation signal domain-containing protein [Ignavibacteria bacterium]
MKTRTISRRNFIRNSAMGAVSLFVIPDFIKNSKIIKPKGAIKT